MKRINLKTVAHASTLLHAYAHHRDEETKHEPFHKLHGSLLNQGGRISLTTSSGITIRDSGGDL